MTHAHFETTPRLAPLGHSARHSGLWGKMRVLLEKIENAFTLWTNRRAIYRLSQLEDRFLADIGISRADVEWALSHPWHVDPSLLLEESVKRRRRASDWARQFNVS